MHFQNPAGIKFQPESGAANPKMGNTGMNCFEGSLFLAAGALGGAPWGCAVRRASCPGLAIVGAGIAKLINSLADGVTR